MRKAILAACTKEKENPPQNRLKCIKEEFSLVKIDIKYPYLSAKLIAIGASNR